MSDDLFHLLWDGDRDRKSQLQYKSVWLVRKEESAMEGGRELWVGGSWRHE